MQLGYHHLWDVYSIPENSVAKVEQLLPLMDEITSLVGLTVLEKSSRQFQPEGATSIYMLSESHLSMHSWPEHNYLAIDLFSCREVDENLVYTFIEELWPSAIIIHKIISRGQIAIT